MENASKALIIAGAILLAILIIALGIFIFNNAKSATEGISMDETKIQAYNSKFEAYQGTQSGANAKALCDLVRTNNNAYSEDVAKQITIQATDASSVTSENTTEVKASTIQSFKNTLLDGKQYKVTIGYNAKTGLVRAIGITAQ
ncbi:MAG: hypothetical protein ACLU8F_04660 [Clostridia bacterium]